MLIVKVKFTVKRDQMDRFIDITGENVKNSKIEPGISQFNLLADLDDDHVFYLLESYNSPEAQAAHRASAHYIHWRSQVTDLLEFPYEIVRMQILA